MKRTRSKLPPKPSALLTLALNDLAKAERSPKYRIDMRVWHDPNAHCSVCFAGSVMAGTLKARPTELLEPDCYTPVIAGQLEALNNFRLSQWGLGLELICPHLSERKLNKVSGILYTAIPYNEDTRYENSRRKFKLSMRRAARILRTYNL